MVHCKFTKVHQWNLSESRHCGSFPSLAAAQQTTFRYLWPRFYWGKQSIRAFEKHLRKTGNIAGVPEKQTPNEQMKKLFDSGELGRAESKNPAQLQRTT